MGRRLYEDFYDDFSCANVSALTSKVTELENSGKERDKFIHELQFFIAITTDPLYSTVEDDQWSKVIINDWLYQIERAKLNGTSGKGTLFNVGDPARKNFRKLVVEAEKDIYFHIKMEMTKIATEENKTSFRVRDLLVPIYFNIMLKPLVVVDALEVDLDLSK